MIRIRIQRCGTCRIFGARVVPFQRDQRWPPCYPGRCPGLPCSAPSGRKRWMRAQHILSEAARGCRAVRTVRDEPGSRRGMSSGPQRGRTCEPGATPRVSRPPAPKSPERAQQPPHTQSIPKDSCFGFGSAAHWLPERVCPGCLFEPLAEAAEPYAGDVGIQSELSGNVRG